MQARGKSACRCPDCFWSHPPFKTPRWLREILAASRGGGCCLLQRQVTLCHSSTARLSLLCCGTHALQENTIAANEWKRNWFVVANGLVLMESVDHSCPTLSNWGPNSPHSIPVTCMSLAKTILWLLSYLWLLFLWILFSASPLLTIPSSNPISWYSLPLFYPFGTSSLFSYHKSTAILSYFKPNPWISFFLSTVLPRAF